MTPGFKEFGIFQVSVTETAGTILHLGYEQVAAANDELPTLKHLCFLHGPSGSQARQSQYRVEYKLHNAFQAGYGMRLANCRTAVTRER